MSEYPRFNLGTTIRCAVAVIFCVGCLGLFACGQEAAAPPAEAATCLQTGCPAGTRCDEIFLICVQEQEADQGSEPDAGNDSSDLDAVEDSGGDPDTREPDETVADVAEEVADVGLEADEQADASDQTAQGETDAMDSSDIDIDEPDPIPVLPSVTNPAATLQLPEGVRLSWELPVDEDGELVTISGIRITLDGSLHQDFGFATINEAALRELVPGEDYQLSIQTFLNTEAGRVFSEEVDLAVSIPEPIGLSLTPRAEIVLASATDDEFGEQSVVNVNLYYGDFEHEPVSGGPAVSMPWAELYRSGARKQSPTATITSTNEDVATVDDSGVITAVAEGNAQIRVEYSWLGGFLSETLDVTVVDRNSQQLLVITAQVDSELEEAPLIRVEVVGASGSSHSLSDGVPLNLLLPVGTHELIVGPVAGPIYRQTVSIRPGGPTRVTIPWTDRADCGNIGAAGGRLVAENGAVLNIPNGALRVTQEVCIRPLGPGLAPRRGPASSYPLLLPQSYEITPNSAELVKNATLSMPIADDLVDFVAAQFGSKVGVLPVYRHELIMWFPETVGRIELIAARQYISAEISQFGVFSAQLCPGVGTAADSCRVAYDSCESDTSQRLEEGDGAFCGDPVTVEVTDEPVGIADLDSNDDVDLAAVSAQAFGVYGSFEQSLSCTTHPCPTGESCDQCMATAAVASCGRTYRGSVERHDGETGWWSVQDVSVLVPVHLGCERVLERCGGDDCLPSTLNCAASCLEGE